MNPQQKALLTAAWEALGPERVTRGLKDQARFLLTRDHIDGKSGFLVDAPNEGGAITRFAHGAGRHRAHRPGPGPFRQLGEALHGGGGAGHCGGREAARAEHLFSQPHGGPIFRQNLGAAGRRHLRDLEADGVRAEVHDREDLPTTLGRRHSPASITKSWIEGTSGCTSTGRREWSVSRWTTTASGKLRL